MSSKQVGKNSLFSVISTISQVISFFLAYRILNDHSGLEAIGVWALLFSLVSLSRVFDISSVGALARFVSKANKDGGVDEAYKYIQAVSICSIGFNLFFIIIVVLVINNYSEFLLPDEVVSYGGGLLFYVGVVVFMQSIVLLLNQVVDGFGRADVRSIINIIGSIGFLVTCFFSIPAMGLDGYIMSLVVQSTLLISLSVIFLMNHIVNIYSKVRFEFGVLKEIFLYGFKIQINSASSLMFEPITKFSISALAGVEQLAIYELCHKVVTQVRSIFVSAVLPLVPVFAVGDSGLGDEKIYLDKAQKYALYIVLLGAVVILVLSPVVEYLVFGGVTSEFVKITFILTLGWMINAYTIPAYYFVLSNNYLRWNILSGYMSTLIFVVMCYPAYYKFGIMGVFSSISFSIAIGAFISYRNNIEYINISFR